MEKVIVEIFAGVNEFRGGCAGCAGGCAPVDTKQQYEDARKYLGEKYADLVEVKYVDTSEQNIADYPEVAQIIKRGYEFPITFVNGEARLASRVPVEALAEIIEELKGQ
ncbi:MAG: hypothetical protein PHU36_02630 [Syntrophomonadaceae bacterium]|nr:hypothetical protein [Syntrophomonadaceae bacterium]